jgi:beta-mannanase
MRWLRLVYVWETEKVHTWFWWGDLRERDYTEDLEVEGG